MSIYMLLENDNPILKVPLSSCSKDLDRKELERNLIDSMKNYKGVGLSANQCGIMERVFVFYEDFQKRETIVCFNPKIIHSSEEEILIEEGCLTWPGLWLKVKRPVWIETEFEDIEGKKITKKYSGFAARIFQHEYDNMEGTNFTKKVSWVRFDMALKRRKKMAKRARQAARQLT